MSAHIFVCEDDLPMAQDLCAILRKYGYEADFTRSFSNVAADIAVQKPDLVLLDINLPQYDGFHICRELRKASEIPVIMITSRDSEMDELMSMNLGADDYVTKPFNMQILLAHIASVLRRSAPVQENVLTHRGAVLNLTRGTLEFAGNTVELTKNELRILQTLMQADGTVSRDTLMEKLWETDSFIDENTLSVNVARLRKKLDSAGLVGFIVTKKGLGYELA